MLTLLRNAVMPLSLHDAIGNWAEISQRLREPPRTRHTQLEKLQPTGLLS